MQRIIKSRDLIADIEKILSEIKYDKLFVLTDEHTAKLCLPMLVTIAAIKDAGRVVIPANDTNKTLENLSHIWKRLTGNGATRHSLLINLGGGMITDIGGFAAATFKRGIKYINIPTTLLGAVDAAVGGKTGINFEGFKNEIGAFYPAEYVFISSHFFSTLDREDILSGFSEMLKHALINTEAEWEKLLAFDAGNIDYGWLTEAISRSVSIKEQIVEKDPFEHNIRKALNLGHTIGHAFESFALETGKPVLHGYAVAWGLISELYLSHRICGFPKDKLQETVRFIHRNYGALAISCDDYEHLYEIMKHDKKNASASFINFTLLSDIGNIQINQTADKELIFQSLDFYRDSVGL
ncbi:MAG: 3-dehydroquinate synthase [Petrimonas sp.]|uniref:3-dehydroquinate synthase n=1 Tax=Petrimonas sp. TaxID=2023866 RepID=UPI00095E6BAE|nr:3-dehydroquinate synthase [Petrimonas sp.]MEA4981002.1 3-dehydroquinate synthase [Petrimonas sp.]MEA5046031.1 3-dehydroquinate synthase [Petrimonas sp.]MEA5062007.1 3-dehydroquinate synthase [Petrimonas sp.]OJV36780.1 MAG: 3-dehydroquinate synthase [Bacteroidia bacterium 43-41]